MKGMTQVGNVIYLRPVRASRRAPRRGGWLVALAATIALAALASAGLDVEPQPLALDDQGRPSMLAE